MATTISRYLKLKIDDNLSADAKSNLAKIDELGAIFRTNTEDNVDISAKGNISLQPGDPAIGGTANQSNLSIGQSSNKVNILSIDALETRVRTLLRLRNGAVGLTDTYLNVVPTVENTNVTLNVSLADSLSVVANRSIIIGHSGRLVFEDATQSLTNKTLSGTSSVNITGSITTTGAISGATLSGLLAGSDVVGNISGNAGNVSGTVAIANGGTGASTADAALVNLLPTYINAGTLKVKADGSGLEWIVGVGQGTVNSVLAPLELTNNNTTVTIPQATSLISGFLSAADHAFFTAKEPAIIAGTTAQYWRGDKSWQTLDKSAVGLGNVDNTSDADKPISSAVSTALSGKEPSISAGTTSQYWRGDKSWQTLDTLAVAENINLYFTDTRARTAAVLNSTAGNETDQAASVSAMKSYVAAQGGGAVSYTWSTLVGTTKSITHNLNKATVSVTIYDENGEDIFVDTVDRTSNDALSLTSSAVPTGNWTVIIRP